MEYQRCSTFFVDKTAMGNRVLIFKDFLSGWRILISVNHCTIGYPSLKIELFLEVEGRIRALVDTSQCTVP